jgi:putative glutathione S-transferase
VCRQLFKALDRCEEILSRQRFIAGDQLTEADVRLFQTLIRFDEVYVVYFKTNRNFIREMPNVKNYVRELYQIPGVCQTRMLWLPGFLHMHAHVLVFGRFACMGLLC